MHVLLLILVAVFCCSNARDHCDQVNEETTSKEVISCDEIKSVTVNLFERIFSSTDLLGILKNISVQTKKMIKEGSFGINISELWKNVPNQEWAKHINVTIEKVESEVEKITKTMTGTIDNYINCTICKPAVKFVKVQTVNASITEIEKSLKTICKLYPIKEATEVCEDIIKKLDEVIKMLKNGVEPGDVCQQMELCNNETISPVTRMVSTFMIGSSHSDDKCTPLCKFMKIMFYRTILKTSFLWMSTKAQLMGFCENNKIEVKCNKVFHMLAKEERKLSKAATNEDDKTTNGCKCFVNQPIFHTKVTNMCLMCQQFEKGSLNDLKEGNESMASIANILEEMCEKLPNSKMECMELATLFRSAFTYLKDQLEPKGVCFAIGICKENIGGIRIGGTPFLLRGGKPLGLGLFGPKKNNS